MVTAEVLRHLLIDPVLPPELLPDDWPAADLREQFARFEQDYAARLREYSDDTVTSGGLKAVTLLLRLRLQAKL